MAEAADADEAFLNALRAPVTNGEGAADGEEKDDGGGGGPDVRLPTESEVDEGAAAYRDLPPLENDEGFPVLFGKQPSARNRLDFDVRRGREDPSLTVYCGRNLGRGAIPRSDGRCGPNDGPQCASCKRLQRGPGRVDILRRKFPGLPREAFISILRDNGGMMALSAWTMREDLGMDGCEVRSGLALLPPSTAAVRSDATAGTSNGNAQRGPEPNEGQVANLMETFRVDRQRAGVALRRNGNDSERAGAWLLDNAPQVIEDAIREWEEEEASRAGELEVLRNRREEEVRRALRAGVPGKALELAREGTVSEDRSRKEAQWEWNEDGTTAVTEGQHFMTRVPSPSRCFHCAAAISPANYRCELCRLCEGCVLAGVALVCPNLFNGGHLHHHPLTYNQDRARRGTRCDVSAGDMCRGNLCCWTCAECDFDSCYECMKTARPDGFDRQAGGTVATPSETAGDAASGSLFPVFDAALSERGAAARWEGNYIEEAEVTTVVGTGDVESAAAPRPNPQGNNAPYVQGNRRGGRLTRRNANFHRGPTLMAETKLSDEAEYALSCFRDPKRLGAGSTDVVAAADITQAETILQRLHAVEDKATSRAVCEAVASGRLDLGGSLLMSEAFAPVAANTGNAEGEEAEEGATSTCVCCHGEIDLETAPDGAVGCLSGHAMHASCASDLLLGGGRCPVCNIPLFYASVPQVEANAAAKIADAELARIKEEEAEKREAQVKDAAIEKGDIVRVSSDVNVCAKTMARHPLSGGWDEELAIYCGTEFCVTEIETHEGGNVQIQVRPLLQRKHALVPIRRNGHRCNRCNMRGPSTQTGQMRCSECSLCQRCCLKSFDLCDSGGRRIAWDPSLVTLVRRAESVPVGDESCVDRGEMLAKDARNHLIRLKAELAAVKGAREKTKASLLFRPGGVTRELTPQSEEAILYVSDKISPADWYRARHLLLLARLWGNSAEAKRLRAKLYSLVRDGSLDSVARIVRRHNAEQTVEAAKWCDAEATSHEYIINPDVHVPLFAFPSRSAPKTGFSLGPKTRFTSKSEVIDSDGIMWLQVSEDSFFDQTAVEGDVCYDGSSSASAIIGARVVRGPNWHYGDQDGGRGTKGTIVAAKKADFVVVEWDSSPRLFNYGAAANSRKLSFAPATPPPQGWACFRPLGPNSPSVAKLARSPFRCFGCGDGLVSPRLASGSFKPAENIERGDKLFVASTLEAVTVKIVQSGRVYCAFSLKNEIADENISRESSIWYRPGDLLARCGGAVDLSGDDVRLVEEVPRTRRELVLLSGNVEKAKEAWNKASEEKGTIAVEEECNFASCARGHLLHARCLQGALLSGQSCPCVGCHEPLYLRQIQVHQDEVTCCSTHGDNEDAEVETLEAAVAEVSEHTTGALDENQEHDFTSAGVRGLRMCPSCCAGPLLNNECSDMRAHHGQCTAYALGGTDGNTPCGPAGAFRAPESEIIAATMKLGNGQSVADVLPRCPTHDVIVMFNGCMACGYLFTDTSWDEMPIFDPKAKSLFELDKKKRKAAMLLAEQIRMESTMLEFERSAVWKLQDDERLLAGTSQATGTKMTKIEPPRVPEIPAYQVNLHEPQNSTHGNGGAVDLFFGEDAGGDY